MTQEYVERELSASQHAVNGHLVRTLKSSEGLSGICTEYLSTQTVS